MIVYRGSKEGKIRPWIHPYSRLLDYGTGFYVTPNKEYAETLAMARGERDFATDCEVVYDFDEEAAARCLKIKHFYSIDNDWKDFIISNRTGISSDSDYDIIYGPAPSPTDYYFFLREESPFAYTPFDISMIKEYREINNYHNPSVIVFKTEKSLSFLKYVDRYGLPRYDKNQNEILYNTEISIEKGVKEPSQFTLEILVKGIIEYAATRTQMPCKELIRKFYASNLYYALVQMNTRVWCLSYVALGETFVRYLNTDNIVYPDDDVIMNLEETLKYRTPRPLAPLSKHTTAWQDLQRAIRIVRSKAESYGLDPDRIGIMGSSAGGHLTLMGVTSSLHKAYLGIDDIDKLPCNVQWGIGIYPAYALTDGSDQHNTTGGNDDSAVIVPEFSFDLNTVPMLMIHGDADHWAAMNSVKVWEKMRAMGVQCELHTLALRPHCFQRKASPGTGSYTWLDRIAEFLQPYLKD